MNMTNRYRIGVIGHTGRGDYGHGIDDVWHDIAGCEIVAVADADDAGRAKALKRLGASKGFADYHQMLDEAKPDIVSICPRWLSEHRDMVVAAAERGIHIYMEKPMTRSLEEADQMVRACEATNVKFAIAFQTRYSPRLRVIRELIDDGQIGEVLEFRGRGKEDARRGGGEDLWVLGTHIMNLIHHLGGAPRWCTASVRQNGHPITRADVAEGAEGIGPLAGDTVHAMYGLDDECAAYFASRRGAGSARFGLRIFGSKGIIEVRTGSLPDAFLLTDSSWSPGKSGVKWLPITSAGVGRPEPLPDRTAHFGNQLACHDLIASIEEDRQPEANIYEARTTVEMIVAVFESQRLGRPVSLPLENRRNPLAMLPM